MAVYTQPAVTFEYNKKEIYEFKVAAEGCQSLSEGIRVTRCHMLTAPNPLIISHVWLTNFPLSAEISLKKENLLVEMPDDQSECTHKP